jgi:hypothetical protein
LLETRVLTMAALVTFARSVPAARAILFTLLAIRKA